MQADTSRPRRHRKRDLALLMLGGAHLLFVANAVTKLVGYAGVPAVAAGFYANVTGAETGYTFFAPRVPFEVSPRVRLFDEGHLEFPAPRRRTREEEFREASLGLYFTQEEAPGLAAAALAADALGRAPDAKTAVVTFTMHWLPTMSEYRQGKRPTDQVVYEAEFGRKDGI